MEKEGQSEIKLNATDRGMKRRGVTRGEDREDGMPAQRQWDTGRRLQRVKSVWTTAMQEHRRSSSPKHPNNVSCHV